ncbi:MAG: CinA family nicotinamide mononucleotide deamidase-related protein [Candidatus Hydrogenedentes bacterium]|nr:CinA family nicotinamide mononucleotide deamidase-related protein [Candidatus Hydrogenedentota bacterium]
MNAEIVMIGTELLLGQIVDSNAAHMGRVLAENGIGLYHKTTVGDNRVRIAKVLESALGRADAVLTSGGLGPTEDDLTREAVSDVFGRPLEFREDAYDALLARFARMRRPVTENNKKQALAPAGATLIPNPNGTAPGLICGDARGEVICMPGVPRELYAMLEDSVIPHLREKHGLKGGLYHRVLKVCGVGESWVDAQMGDLMARLENPTIGVLASPEWVRIRITARADTAEDARARIADVESQIRERMPGRVMGVDDETLEGAVDPLLRARGWTFATGETFTGGMIAQRMVANEAASFVGGLTHSPADTRWRDARALAQETQRMFASDCALGISTEPQDRNLNAVFLTPESEAAWQTTYSVPDGLGQLRAAVICMERVRRFLSGYPAD